jgi:hypothetical protein
VRCPKCNRNTLRQKVNVFVDAPVPCSNLSKSGLKLPTVKIDGVGWDRAVYYCSSEKCGWMQRKEAS